VGLLTNTERWAAHTALYADGCSSLFSLPLARLLVLRKVPKLGDVVEHRLQIIVADLALQRWDQRPRLLGSIAAKRT